jgi:RHS repeat-associated protein
MYGFDGEQTDPAGLIYLRARQYLPYLGQFISKDTWQGDNFKPISFNSWLYGFANPITHTDPNGKSPIPDSEFQSCVSSSKLNGVAQGIKENVCGMISELEDKEFLTNIPDENHIPDNGGLRSKETAHRWSTAYHILHDFVLIDDLRKNRIDIDGNIWYRDEWDFLYCTALYPNSFLDPQTRLLQLGYLDYLIKKNASANAKEIHFRGNISGYIITGFGLVRDVSYALEGYPTGDPFRLPNVSDPAISKHVSGHAVDVSEGILREDLWGETGYTEIDRIAHNHRLKRPLNSNDYVTYTDDEIAEWWHFEPFGK